MCHMWVTACVTTDRVCLGREGGGTALNGSVVPSIVYHLRRVYVRDACMEDVVIGHATLEAAP